MATVSKGKLKLQRLNKINVPLVGLIIVSTWSYENRVSKHFVIVLSFPCLIACLLCCLLMSFFFFLLIWWLGICVEVDVDRIIILPLLSLSLPTILSLIRVKII